MGPTASGKTDLAIALAQHLPIDIISVDSALIYRGMDIGTVKPTPKELAQAPHALINIRDPAETYSVAEFCEDACKEIEKSHAQHRIPVLVGGTMMYFNALLQGLADMPLTDEATRAQLEQEAQQKGWPALHSDLMQIDPDSAAEIHPNHSQRIERALAVYRISGKTMSAFRREQQRQSSNTFADQYQLHQFSLMPDDRRWLHQRIKQRYQIMLNNGFVQEVEHLFQRGDLHLDLPSIRSVGYRQVWTYLVGEYDYDAMVEKGVAATRQLAKRQLTWLRGWESLHILTVEEKTTTLAANFDKNLHQVLKFLSN